LPFEPLVLTDAVVTLGMKALQDRQEASGQEEALWVFWNWSRRYKSVVLVW
jgi:hypothetical protein